MTKQRLTPVLEWLCQECDLPIPDGEGVLYMLRDDLDDAKTDLELWTVLNPGTRYTARQLISRPEPASWRVVHARCFGVDWQISAYAIEVERVRTYGQLLNWTAHLMDKEWIMLTDWAEIIAARSEDPDQ